MGGKVITGALQELELRSHAVWHRRKLRERQPPVLLFIWQASPLLPVWQLFQAGSPCSESSKKHHLHLFIPQVDQWLTICSCHVFLPILWFLFKIANSFQHKDSPMSVLKTLSVWYTFHSGQWFFNISLYESPFNEDWPSCLTPLQQLKQQLNQRWTAHTGISLHPSTTPACPPVPTGCHYFSGSRRELQDVLAIIFFLPGHFPSYYDKTW